MSCGLPPEALFILDVFYKGRNFRSDAGYHSEKLRKIFIKKFPERSSVGLDDTLKLLLNRGYVGKLPKKEVKYYIVSEFMSQVIFALTSHGYRVTKGRVSKL